MATDVTGSNRVVLTEHALMEDALNRVVPPGTHVRVDELVTALRNSRRYGVYFQKVNRHGLSRTLSRWLRAGAFRNHALVSGVGICNVIGKYNTDDGSPAFKEMTLEFNVPKQMQEQLSKF